MNPALKEYRDIAVEMGVEMNKEETAIKLFKLNLPVKQIADVTGLSEEKITELQRQVAVEA